MAIYLSQKAQISGLIQDKAPTKVPPKYKNYADVFLFDLAIELPENTRINNHAIKLQHGKQPLYRPIYSLGQIELKTFKTYIEPHLEIGFIWPSKSPAGASILFNKKPDGSLWLCVDYWGFNNLTTENQYLLPLIGEALDCLGRVKRFIQLDLTSAYHWMRIRKSDK